VLVPGHIGERSARNHLDLTGEQVVEVGNEWGYTLDRVHRYSFENILVWGHPGKLAKLAVGDWDTHSSRSGPALDVVRNIFADLGPWSLDLGTHTTTEGFFLSLGEDARTRLADEVSEAVARACTEKTGGETAVAVVLVNMAGEVLGMYGDTRKWKWRK
jgi:cobalt-precorrin-5B (C1)-methyltransferase